MVLNSAGGPNLVYSADAPIIVHEESAEFYKQPIFYAHGHFSKFALPESERLNVTVGNNSTLQVVAFLRPDNLTAVMIHNK